MTSTASEPQKDRNNSNEPVTKVDEPALENGSVIESEPDAPEEGPPSKRRRVTESVSIISKVKPVSPPWKKAVAEGPTSFVENGRRKSGRTNSIPLELQPPSDKRQTRGAVQKTYSSKGKNRKANGHATAFQARDVPGAPANGSKKPGTSATASSQQPPSSPSKIVSPSRSHHRKSMPSEQVSTPVRSHRKQPPKTPQTAPAQARPPKGRRSGRVAEIVNKEEHARPQPLKDAEPLAPSPKGLLSRIKLRVRPASLPLTHPGLILARPKQYPTLKEFFDHGESVHVDEGGLYHPEEPSEYTRDQIAKDIGTILRAEEVAEEGGILSQGVCSAFQPEEPERFPPQYSHTDHMNRAAFEFRRLMLIEQRKHRATAKRLAEACQNEWQRRQPKSAQDLEAEEARTSLLRYKTLVKTLQATWDNVKIEVNKRRLAEWEVQEQARVRKALSEAVDISTQKLQARRARTDSEAGSDGNDSESSAESDDEDIGRGSETDERGSNMSSESEAEDDQTKLDVAGDENLTVEQLREKYAGIPNLEAEDEEMADFENSHSLGQDHATDIEETVDDSDESIDMDDDMGSSDEDRDSDEEEESNEENEDDAGDSSLLGFLTPAELKGIDLGRVVPLGEPTNEDDPGEHASKSITPEVETEMSQLPQAFTNGTEDFVHDGFDDVTMQATETSAEMKSDCANEPKHVTTELRATSPDRSSQPTPRTTGTRPSEIDSASSVELQQISRHATRSATPQPNSHLKTPVPFLLRGTLREYQHYGLDWLARLYANNTNGILADEMGLGKTIQTIALLAHLACEHEIWGPHLVIVPTSVMLNWEMEFKKFLPGFKILTYYGTQEERKKKRSGWKSEDAWNVCITSYQLVLQDQQVFKRRRWHYMILDEAHNIKNFNSQRWQTMLTFNTRARLLLTGTPLQNNLNELWSLLYFLMPSDGTAQGVGGFADLKEFQDWFKKPSEQILEHGRDQMDDESRGIISKLHKLLRPYLLRRLKADVEKQMPAKHEHVEFCRLSKRQRELYDGFLSRDDTRGTLAGGNYLSIINCLMQLRKVCNHPDLFIERAIMTSFPMEKAAIADFEIKELIVRRRLLREDPMTKASLEFLNLVPTNHERFSSAVTLRSSALNAQRLLMDMREAQRMRAQNALTPYDSSTSKSNLGYLESASRWTRFEELQHCVYLNALRRQQKPIYGSQLVERLTLGLNERPLRPQPKQRSQLLAWLETRSPVLEDMVPTIQSRALSLSTTIRKFACVTPPVVARDMNSMILSPKSADILQRRVDSSTVDPFHEARMRLSIQFPDKRLLQYDCGKLQTLDKLLRKLQAGGHRALIFTQMTKVLDILEQFLNIHGHKYLRLDGSTKIEQRQILTDRFNNDTRILAFILSTRSGGLGINLTGADTVIFYDLDWNPAMDKQCQDRCHRIGQTRDVHIYRLVSEHTIEANILRKANQKRMLDDVVIQEGEFTTDYFNRPSVREKLVGEPGIQDDDAAAANAAMDRVLGGPNNEKEVQHVLAQAEDREDAAAAKVAERELVQTDSADFDENPPTASATPAGVGTPREGAPTPVTEDAATPADSEDVGDEDELNAWGERVLSTDDFMLSFMTAQLKDTPIELPKDKSKRGRDHRSHRAR